MPVPAGPSRELVDLETFLQERDKIVIQIVKQLDRFLSAMYNACFHEGHSKAIQVQRINIKALSRANKVVP